MLRIYPNRGSVGLRVLWYDAASSHTLNEKTATSERWGWPCLFWGPETNNADPDQNLTRTKLRSIRESLLGATNCGPIDVTP